MNNQLKHVEDQLQGTIFDKAYETSDGIKRKLRRIVEITESVIRPDTLIVTFSDGSQTNVKNL